MLTPPIVNVVSKIPPQIWERQKVVGGKFRFTFSRFPEKAEFHVVYGIRDPLKIENSSSKILFVASEPPEIRKYDLAVLAKYGLVLGPSYPYLQNLPNFRYAEGLAPWWLGVDGSSKLHYEDVNIEIAPTRSELEQAAPVIGNRFTTFVSEKSRTPLQVQRQKLADFLSSRIPELEVMGRRTVPFTDKTDLLRESRFHLAIENSQHQGYWTEKLADPMLMSSVVFYSGDPTISSKFNPGGVEVVNPFLLEETYRRIMERLDREVSAGEVDSLYQNRNLILGKYNFQSAIETILGSYNPVRQIWKRSPRVLMPAHSQQFGMKRILAMLGAQRIFR